MHLFDTSAKVKWDIRYFSLKEFLKGNGQNV